MDEKILWVEKYKPKILSDYIWPNNSIRETIESWIEKKQIQSVLLTGSPGTGKTSLSNLLISNLDLDENDVLRLKGSVDNNAETIRTTVMDFCESGGWSGQRIVFFDEADNLSYVAQLALRSVMDDYINSVRFILTCNFPHRIIEPISLSRLIRIDFENLDKDLFIEKAVLILIEHEKVEFDDNTIDIVRDMVDKCYPDIRRLINMLQFSVKDGKLVKVNDLKTTTGTWETFFTGILSVPSDPIKELLPIRDVLVKMTPDEMINVYKFLVNNGEKFFGDNQINALFYINAGQKSHNTALLPDLILLEVFLRLMMMRVKNV